MSAKETAEKLKKVKKEVSKQKKERDKLIAESDSLNEVLNKLEEEFQQREQDFNQITSKIMEFKEDYVKERRKAQRHFVAQIDRDCDSVFARYVESSEELKVEIIFENQSTIISVDDVITPTFGDLKSIVAQLYYLSEKDFYLSDSNDRLFLDITPVRPVLARATGYRLKRYTPKVKVILKEFKAYGDLLGATRLIELGDESHRLPNTGMLEMERKKIVDTSNTGLKAFRDTFSKYKGFVVMCFFTALIALFVVYLSLDNRVAESYYFQKSLETQPFINLFRNLSVLSFINTLTNPNLLPPDLNELPAGYFLKSGRVVATHYSTVACPNTTSPALEQFYNNRSFICKSGAGADRQTPFIFTDGNQTQNVSYFPTPGGSAINTLYGQYSMIGYQYDFSIFTNTTLHNKTLNGLFNISTARWAVLILNYIHPPSGLIAQLNYYTAIYNYNVTTTNVTANILNSNQFSTAQQGIILSITIITSILLTFSFGDLFRILLRKNEKLDHELLLYREKQAKKARGETFSVDLRTFWVFRWFPLVTLILYLPTLSELIAFSSLCFVIVSLVLRTTIARQILALNYNSEAYFNLSTSFDLQSGTKKIFDTLVLILVMYGLINQIIGFLKGELLYFQKVIGKVSSELVWFILLVVWMLLVSTLSNMTIFGADDVNYTKFGQSFFYQLRRSLKNSYTWETYYDPENRVLLESNQREIQAPNYIIPNILFVFAMKYVLLSIFLSLILKIFPEVREIMRETRKTLNILSLRSLRSIGKKKESAKPTAKLEAK